MRTYKGQSNFSFVVKNKRKNKNLTLKKGGLQIVVIGEGY